MATPPPTVLQHYIIYHCQRDKWQWNNSLMLVSYLSHNVNALHFNANMLSLFLVCDLLTQFEKERGGPLKNIHILDCRWNSPECLMINVSAHSTQLSLLEVVGWVSKPRKVLAMTPSGSTASMTPVASLEELSTGGTYLLRQLDETFYALLISFDNMGLGHSITMCA